MKAKFTLLIIIIIGISQLAIAQKGSVSGVVKVNNVDAEFAQVQIESLYMGATCNNEGKYLIKNIPFGTYKITASYIGYNSISKEFTINEKQLHNLE